jgi:hypothetical protein
MYISDVLDSLYPRDGYLCRNGYIWMNRMSGYLQAASWGITMVPRCDRRMVVAVLEVEAEEYVAAVGDRLDERGRGWWSVMHVPERTITTAVGVIPIRTPRANDNASTRRLASDVR